MKNKFDIVYEAVIDDVLKKAEVNYTLIDDFKNQIKDELSHLKETEDIDAIKSYLEFVYDKKVKRCYPLYKDDRLNALKEVCKETLGYDLGDILDMDKTYPKKEIKLK